LKNQCKKQIIGSFLACLLFFGCKKYDPLKDCLNSTGSLLVMSVNRYGWFTKSPLKDTSNFLIQMWRGMVGLKQPSLAINGRNYEVTPGQGDMCLLNSSEDSIPNSQQPSWFLFGQNNTLNLTGEIPGSVTEQFPMPKELRVTTPASFIIHRNTDFTLDITGVDDYPLPITAGGNPQDEYDQIRLDITYDRKYSDTLTYPTLPQVRYGTGSSYQKTDNGKVTVNSGNLKSLPLNGGASVTVTRYTNYKLPNGSKGPILFRISQYQYERFTIKD